MKNPTVWAAAALSAAAGAAQAQSSVTLYGTLDVNARYVKADGQHRRLSESTDGLNSSQLALRGIEDLGDGLKASFILLAGINEDNGTTNAKFFNRRSTLSLSGRFGELRLGRDYTPTFWSQAIFDAFGYLGLGNPAYAHQLYGGTRMDNAIGYFLPQNLGGFYGQAMAAAAEGGSSADRPARYLGGRFGYATGPFDAAVAYSEQRFVAAAGPATPGDKQKGFNAGASWDFGVFKLLGHYDRESLADLRENLGSVSAVVPFGQGEIHVGYDRSQLKNDATDAKTTVDHIKLSYVYNLSKRTALYTTLARLDNKDATTLTLPDAAGPTTPGGKSQGAEFGIRHFF